MRSSHTSLETLSYGLKNFYPCFIGEKRDKEDSDDVYRRQF